MNKKILLVLAIIAVAASVALLKWKSSTSTPLAEAPVPATTTVAEDKATPAVASSQPTPVAPPVTSQPSIPAASKAVAAAHPVASAPAATAPARPATFPVQVVDPNDPPLVDGQMVKAHIVVGNESGDLIPNQFGEFPRVHIDPKQTVSVTASWPDAQPGQKVVAAVEDGGLLAGGKPVLAFTLDASRQVSFDFTAGSGRGIYRVTLRQGPDTKIVQFWAGPDLALKQM